MNYIFSFLLILLLFNASNICFATENSKFKEIMKTAGKAGWNYLKDFAEIETPQSNQTSLKQYNNAKKAQKQIISEEENNIARCKRAFDYMLLSDEAKNFIEKLDLEKINNYENAFNGNKNDTKKNKTIYMELSEKKKDVNPIYDKMYSAYKEKYKNCWECKNIAADFDIFLKKNPCSLDDISYISKFKTYVDKLSSLETKIFDYSYDFEKSLYIDWVQQNHKKTVYGHLDKIVYSKTMQPVQNMLYVHNPNIDFPLVVQQTIPNGILVSGSSFPNVGYYPDNNIFIQTSKAYPDGAYITNFLILEFKGFYDYTTVLGSRKRVYKFYQYNEKDINSTFGILDNFYFYTPF